jgi:hypothetical protein
MTTTPHPVSSPTAANPNPPEAVATGCGSNAAAPSSSPAPRTVYDRNELRNEHSLFVARIAALRAPRIFLEPEPEDFNELAEYLGALLEAVKEHHGKVCTIAGMNGAGNLDDLIGAGDAALSDLQSDFRGAMQRVAERLSEERYEGCGRGPMYRSRG